MHFKRVKARIGPVVVPHVSRSAEVLSRTTCNNKLLKHWLLEQIGKIGNDGNATGRDDIGRFLNSPDRVEVKVKLAGVENGKARLADLAARQKEGSDRFRFLGVAVHGSIHTENLKLAARWVNKAGNNGKWWLRSRSCEDHCQDGKEQDELHALQDRLPILC